MSELLTPPPSPLLNYTQTPPSPPAIWALRISLLTTGIVAFTAGAFFTFLAAAYFHLPNLLGIYPIAFALAVHAALTERHLTRYLGIGAITGAVFTCTVGYTIGLLWMTRL